MKLRRALELMGFARLVWKDTSKLDLWLHSVDSETAYQRYQEAFSGKPLRACLSELHSRLPQDYDRTTRMSHSSLASIAHAFEHSGESIRMHLFDQPAGDVTPLVLAMATSLQTHLDATTGFARLVFKGKEWREAKREWKRSRDPAVGAFGKEKERWRNQIARYNRNLQARGTYR